MTLWYSVWLLVGHSDSPRVCSPVYVRSSFRWCITSTGLLREWQKWICTRTGNSPQPRRERWNGGDLQVFKQSSKHTF